LQNATGSKYIRIEKKPIDIWDDGENELYHLSCDDERDVQVEDSNCVEINHTSRADHYHSLTTIADRLQGLDRHAEADVTDYTLFTMPFLSLLEVLFLLTDS